MAASDEQLMRQVCAGDESAFDELYSRYSGLVNGFLLRAIGRPEVASDLAQETFLHLFRARCDFDPSRALKPWLMTIALNVKREYFRAYARNRESVSRDGELPEGEVQKSSSDAAETGQIVKRALAALREDQRDLVLLRWHEGFSYAEIGQMLGISENSAKVRAHRAREAMKEKLAKWM